MTLLVQEEKMIKHIIKWQLNIWYFRHLYWLLSITLQGVKDEYSVMLDNTSKIVNWIAIVYLVKKKPKTLFWWT